MTTYTTHYNLNKPDVGASANTWGSDPGGLNESLDIIDQTMKDIETVADAALPKAGGAMTGDITFSAADVGTTALPAAQVHASELLIHQPGGATLAAISTAGALTAVTVTQTSDAILKSDIGLLSPEASLAAVRRILPRGFRTSQDEGAREHEGFIAQEVREHLPCAVAETNTFLAHEKRHLLAIDHGALIANLWGAVQALAAEIDKLKAPRVKTPKDTSHGAPIG